MPRCSGHMTPLIEVVVVVVVVGGEKVLAAAAYKSRVHNNGGFAFMSRSSGSVLDLPFRLNRSLAPTTAAQVQQSGGAGGAGGGPGECRSTSVSMAVAHIPRLD